MLLVLVVHISLQANAQKIVDAAHVICPCVCAEHAPAIGVFISDAWTVYIMGFICVCTRDVDCVEQVQQRHTQQH